MAKKNENKDKNKDKNKGPAGLSTNDSIPGNKPEEEIEDQESLDQNEGNKPEIKEPVTHPEKPPKGFVRVEAKTRIFEPVNGLAYPTAVEMGCVVDVPKDVATKAKEFEATDKGLTKDIPYSGEFTK